MERIFLLTFLLLPTIHAHRQHREPVAITPNGRIQGSLFTSRLGRPIFSFRGIRYAKAPINELRFQPPEPAEWSGFYNATQDALACPQLGYDLTSEDCLFLNVYTTELPSRTRNPKRPVIVFLHHGAFLNVGGRSDFQGPQYLLDEDVVLVTFNYRLGMFGYISTGTKEAPGNLGQKDQVLALKWVKDNIIHFGGDPDSITLHGYSAGAATVYLHMMSPMAKGLFHKGIAGSTSPFGTWPRRTNLLNLVKRHATLLNCPVNTVVAMINCLRTIPAETIAQSIVGLREFGDAPLLTYEPVIEPDFGQERYLTKLPIEMALNGEFENVPLMAGITKDEFGQAAIVFAANQTLLKEFNDRFDEVLPILMDYERNTEKSRKFSQTLRKFYFGDKPVDNSTLTGMSQLNADSIGFAVNRAVRLISAKSSQPVYYYHFAYQGRYSNYYYPNTTTPFGVVHHDDLLYLYVISALFPEFTPSDPESRIVDKMIKLWTNFAKTGNPTPKCTSLLDNVTWTPFTVENSKYLNIDEQLEMKSHLHDRRYQAWEEALPLSS